MVRHAIIWRRHIVLEIGPAQRKRCARELCRESTASTPMFASYLQTVEEVTAVLAGCSYCETWSPRRARTGETKRATLSIAMVLRTSRGEKLSGDVRNYVCASGVRTQQVSTYKILVWNIRSKKSGKVDCN